METGPEIRSDRLNKTPTIVKGLTFTGMAGALLWIVIMDHVDLIPPGYVLTDSFVKWLRALVILKYAVAIAFISLMLVPFMVYGFKRESRRNKNIIIAIICVTAVILGFIFAPHISMITDIPQVKILTIEEKIHRPGKRTGSTYTLQFEDGSIAHVSHRAYNEYSEGDEVYAVFCEHIAIGVFPCSEYSLPGEEIGSSAVEEVPETEVSSESSIVSVSDIVGEMITCYGSDDPDAPSRLAGLSEELRDADPDKASRWDDVFSVWDEVNNGLVINDALLPEGLPQDDSLCLVVLGFQLESDGSMREELIQRLETALACAGQYPNAYIACTGGGTAAQNASATEAGCMAQWLIDNGVDESRVIVEDRSLTTAQNAVFTYRILREQYPQVDRIAIISSDYHIPTGVLLFETQDILNEDAAGERSIRVVSNASCDMDTNMLPLSFQTRAMGELVRYAPS